MPRSSGGAYTPNYGNGRPITQDMIDQVRAVYETAEDRLLDLVEDACPSGHSLVQHRDRRPPWCPHCRRTKYGVPIDVAPR